MRAAAVERIDHSDLVGLDGRTRMQWQRRSWIRTATSDGTGI
jgi:hypothetical protein